MILIKNDAETMTNRLQTTNAVHIKPYDKQTACCKEMEGTCLCLKENISRHFFNNHSLQVSRALYLGVLNYF